MTNDCLVTKLKGVVDNPNLMPIGTRNIEVERGIIDPHIGLNERVGLTIKVVGDGTFSVQGVSGYTEYTADDFIEFHPEPASGKETIKINVSNWYKVIAFNGNGCPMDTEDLKYTSLDNWSYTTIKGKLTNLMGKNILNVRISGQFNIPTDGSLLYTEDEFVATLRSWSLTSFTQFHANGFGVSAYIYGKAMPDTITSIELNDADYGTIEDFVRGLRQNRTSGTIQSFGSGSHNSWTFNGEEAYGFHELSWTATTITYNGVTINA